MKIFSAILFDMFLLVCLMTPGTTFAAAKSTVVKSGTGKAGAKSAVVKPESEFAEAKSSAVKPETGFTGPQNSINLGAGGMVGPNTTASAFFIEYERLLGSRIAVFGRGGSVSYTYDDGTYVEDGDPKGFDIGVRAYPMGRGGMKGFYVGGALGYWKTDWTFTDDKGYTYEKRGKGDSSSVRADIEVGGRFNLGTETVSIMPAFHIGHFFSSSNSCTYTYGASGTCNKDSEVGLYGFFALSVGIAF